MSDKTPPRRSKQHDAPVAPQGYRSTRRSSKAVKAANRAEREHRAGSALASTGKLVRDVGYYLALLVGTILVGVLVLLVLASAFNGIVRWSARRAAERANSSEAQLARASENLLIIGEQNGRAVGFIAARIDANGKQIYGIAIPDGAFIEVPGQGFEKIGASYSAGPKISLSAISNFLTVPFNTYVVVPSTAYTDAVKRQSLSGITAASEASSLSTSELDALGRTIASVSQKSTAIVPLPVKPIKLGTQTYFDPQRAQVADLLKLWWGVDASKTAAVTRVILYNGAGKPGRAGEAAQQLIRAGFRVVDTKNADNFKYAKTQIIVQRGDAAQGNAVAKTLGVGQVSSQPSDQDVAEVIVIIGKDYKPPVSGSDGGTK